MESNYKRLGNYIKEIDVRNSDSGYSNLIGVSINKQFIPSVANIIGTDLSKYKIIEKNQFACSLMQVSRDGGIAISLYKDSNKAIMSPAYYIFEIIDDKQLMPEYLELIVYNPEFDREAVFNAIGGVRGTLTWEDFCDMKVNIPDITEQEKIVRQYKTITDRIGVLEKINGQLEKMIQCTFKELFLVHDNYEGINTLGGLTNTIDNRGKTPPNNKKKTLFPLLEIASLKTDGRIVSYENCEKYVDEDTYKNWFRSGHPKQYDILFSTVGSIGNFKIFMGNKGCIAQNIVGFRSKDDKMALYLYQSLLNKINNILSYEIGSVQASIKVSQIVDLEIETPNEKALKKFNLVAIPATDNLYANEMEIEHCYELRRIMISQLT